MFVAMSRFTLANDKSDEVRQAFRERPHLVDDAAGFLRMDVMSPREHPREFWLLTFWTDEASYRTWHRSHEYHESHAGIPKGLKLVPSSARIDFFDLVAS
jgi:heme oxygenase (mycobilin-producing)